MKITIPVDVAMKSKRRPPVRPSFCVPDKKRSKLDKQARREAVRELASY